MAGARSKPARNGKAAVATPARAARRECVARGAAAAPGGGGGALGSCTVSRWGNSLGIRIPREAAERLQLTAGAQVSLEVNEGAMTIRPLKLRRKWGLGELLAGVTPAKVAGEFRWGKAVGRELI